LERNITVNVGEMPTKASCYLSYQGFNFFDHGDCFSHRYNFVFIIVAYAFKMFRLDKMVTAGGSVV
jgi:hypothetical protein